MAGQVVLVGSNPAVARDWLIQGKGVDSLPEVYVALALDKFGWRFEYLASFFGFQFHRGGLQIDFRVFTVPKQTFLFVDGAYWHGSPNAREQDKIERVKLFAASRKYAYEPVVLVASECNTPDKAEAAVAKLFGRS